MNEQWAVGALVGGAYRLEGPIGKGGFGAVFRGRRLSDGEPVAIKLLTRTAMVREDGVARFKREAELAMLLKHESTIRVLDSGDAGDGTPFIAFELLQGSSLDEVLLRGPLPADQAVAVGLALLGSLAEAHALGIVHRDVKPANVFMCAHPSGLIKLLDFGVAKSTVSSDLALTAEGLMVGTPAYMAPEQISGREVSPPTDLYAVALVVAEVLTGRPVYDAAPLQVCMDKVRGLPRPFDSAVRGVSFFEVLERATCSEPRSRYGSAEEMTAALLQAKRSSSSSVPPLARSVSSHPPGRTEIIELPFAASDPRPADARSLSPATREAARLTALASLNETMPIATPRMAAGAMSSGMPSSGSAYVGTPSSGAEAMASTLKDEDGQAVVASAVAAARSAAVAQPATQVVTVPLHDEARALTRMHGTPWSVPATSPAPARRAGLALLLIGALLLALGALLAWLFDVPPFAKGKRKPRSTANELGDDPRHRKSTKSSANAETDDDSDGNNDDQRADDSN